MLRDINQGQLYTAQDIKRHLEDKYQVHYRRTGVYSLLQHLGVKKKVPRPHALKADAQAAQGWKKGGLTVELHKQQVSASAVIVWADEMRDGLIGQVRRVWAGRGYKPVQRMQLVYDWGYLALAVDRRAGKLHWAWQANMKKESCAATLTQFKQSGVAAVIWDGALGHRAKLTWSGD